MKVECFKSDFCAPRTWKKWKKRRVTWENLVLELQKQSSRGVLRKRGSGNIQQIYRRIPMICNFIEVTLRHGVLQQISCIFSEDLFQRTPLECCFWNRKKWTPSMLFFRWNYLLLFFISMFKSKKLLMLQCRVPKVAYDFPVPLTYKLVKVPDSLIALPF